LSARIWTNNKKTLKEIKQRHAQFMQRFDLQTAFKIDGPIQEPPFNSAEAFRILNADLGSYIGIDF
jgi:hypothetical protein